jgi:hypothetical protein
MAAMSSTQGMNQTWLHKFSADTQVMSFFFKETCTVSREMKLMLIKTRGWAGFEAQWRTIA